MYPATFFGLFPAFPRDWRAFVAMSFEERFTPRWENVLRPALKGVEIDGHQLEPHRVDLTMSSDSILTNILDEISRCRVLVADITTLGRVRGGPVRNQNVFYEIGLAHAVRLPEEVLLFRSDKDKLAFDISNVRVHHYDPDGKPDEARALVTKVVEGSLKELDVRKSLAVRRAADRLDLHSWWLLVQARSAGSIASQPQQIAALSATRLLDPGAIQAEVGLTDQLLQRTTGTVDELIRYSLTPFGTALIDHVFERMGATSVSFPERS